MATDSMTQCIKEDMINSIEEWFSKTHESIMSTPTHIAGFGMSKQSISKWDRRFLDLAKHIAEWSKDPSTKCGAVITKGNKIISLGFNGLASGIEDYAERLANRDVKYKMVIHAEENAIIFAKQDLKGCAIYTWPFPPCSSCAAKIIQTGIKRVIAPIASSDLIQRWGDSLKISTNMYDEVGVEFVEVADV